MQNFPFVLNDTCAKVSPRDEGVGTRQSAARERVCFFELNVALEKKKPAAHEHVNLARRSKKYFFAFYFVV